MKNLLILFCSFLLNGVFGDTEVKGKEGDSVTLHINPQDLIGVTDLALSFKDRLIANIDIENKNKPPVVTNEDVRFRGRLELDRQTGSLTITNITPEDSGEYKLEISSMGGIKHKTFRVSVSGEVKMSFMKGDDVTLHTNATRIETDDDIQWKFGNTLIVHLNKTAPYITYNDVDGRYTNRLNLDWTGSLIIKSFRSEDSGRYDVYITGSKNIHKTFHVAASSQRSNGEKTGPGSLLVLILMGIFMMN